MWLYILGSKEECRRAREETVIKRKTVKKQMTTEWGLQCVGVKCGQ